MSGKQKGNIMIKPLKNKDNIISLVFIALISALVIIGLYFHEPWFDEAQAYLIARDASWHDILFFWTHYEGHPPLWHIILKFAITLGLPYEFTLKAINFIFFEAVLFLIEFRSPFSRITKTIIPFSYFLLYQYSVISRPYMLLLLAVLLAAMFYKERYDKPVRYCLSLMLMCSVHSYGIALAGGIVIADLLSEAVHGHSIKKCIMRVVNNRKLLIFYTVLLAFALFLIVDIMPRSDTYAVQEKGKHSFFICYLLSFLFIPSETLFTSYSSNIFLMQNEINPTYEVLSAALISLVIWICLFIICKKRKMLIELFIPYCCISVLTSVYAMPRHFGIFLGFLIYILWIASDKSPIVTDEFAEKLKKTGLSQKMTKTLAVCSAAVLSAVNLYWSAICYCSDIKNTFYPGKEFAGWIKENNLSEKYFLAAWEDFVSGACITTNTYFDHVFYHAPYDEHTFLTHIMHSDEEMRNEVKSLKAEGEPDFIICGVPAQWNEVAKSLDLKDKYNAVAFSESSSMMFKNRTETIELYVMCTDETYRELYGKDYSVPVFEK